MKLESKIVIDFIKPFTKVLDDGALVAVRLGEQMVEQRRLARAEVAGEHGDGNRFFLFHAGRMPEPGGEIIQIPAEFGRSSPANEVWTLAAITGIIVP